mmetsp:Transcript_19822/g.23779  ORF Transcript_19822/g.23779 Transcript_19822/m.23779 type:complete len:508 (-) Transcript_19822:971-2494(-)|eukprot:CAMPEP_0197867438 /NCGR_PEP_ID=MMETSP1438-20131217/44757_1 /TAXON_ID=1461541 /ORGANISM="Pterosperma sp., Strain CCMP1384" /LENGTH=507 /DNA_ID=CAMNT_0043486089 /DNA_START=342 /DNA_END=1865 /DNA_ORIENTATION=-
MLNGLASGGATTPLASPSGALDWKFSQVFGERAPGEEIQEADIISAVEFDQDGDHLATGDRGGRVVLFELVSGSESKESRRSEERRDSTPRRGVEYRYLTEFQSHEPEFDYLKSLEIEEKINKIRWCQGSNGGFLLLSTNDKTIKLWKVFEKGVKNVTNFNIDPPVGGWGLNSPGALQNGGVISGASPRAVEDRRGAPRLNYLRFPTVQTTESILTARCRRIFANAHAYHINSISLNSDKETYVSADDLRVNLWNLEISNQSFNIVDIKPSSMEDLTEVITSAEFHPIHCHILAYSSSKGNIRLADMRERALCDQHSKLFEEQEPAGTRNFFSEIIASISDIKFSACGRYFLSRDYLNLKLWDINMDSAPVKTFPVHEHLRPKLCDLYENDSIFDKFECNLSGDGQHVSTGSYSNMFRVFGVNSGSEAGLEASKNPQRRSRSPAKLTNRLGFSRGRRDSRGSANGSEAENFDQGCNDFSAKLLHLAWHPTTNAIAAAASNSLYIFYA